MTPPRGRTNLASLLNPGQPTVASTSPHVPTAPAVVTRARLEELAHNPFNPRIELTAIREMADSLAGRGVIQPLTVVTRDAFIAAHPGQEEALGAAAYVVVDGNRRLAGSHLAGLTDVPVHIDDALTADAESMLEAALVAAVQHQDLEPLDEAKALQQLVGVHGSQREVGRRLGKSSGWVSQRLSLLTLTPELQQAVEEKALPVEVARSVGRLPAEEQQQAVQERMVRAPVGRRARRVLAPAGSAAGGAYGVSTPEVAPVPRPAAVQPDSSAAGAYAVSTPVAAVAVPAFSDTEEVAGAYGVSTADADAGPVVVRLLPGAAAEVTAEVLMPVLPRREWVAVIEVMLDQLRVD